MSYTETRTQEDIAELHAQYAPGEYGSGCKACGQPIAPGTACASAGDIYCWNCGLHLDQMPDTEVLLLPTRTQVAELARLDAAGIGTN